MNREQKAAVIEEIAGEISGSEAIFAVDYRGLTVAQAADLRERLREADAHFRVVFEAIEQLMEQPEPPTRRRIGFGSDEEPQQP